MIICVAATVLSSAAALMIQEKFLSSVVMFPTSTNSFGQILTEETSKEDLLEFGEKEEGERLLQIINSDEIRSRIIAKYNLYKHYDIDQSSPGANAKIQKEYDSNISSQMTRFGSVRVDVLDANPDTAMFIANDIASLVDTVNNRLRNDRALLAFHYAEAEYLNLLSEIKVLEDSMASLRSIGVFDYITQIEGMNEQYATAIASGQPGRAEELRKQMAELSQYGNTYSKLETLIESSYEREATLKKRYELLKIDVNSKLSAKFVVNTAQKADKKSYPVRWLIVVMSVASAFVFSIVALLILENIRKLRGEGRLG
jgi:uncharacterized protein involved in exopolysaccharide biosynthesis